jgi:hypothetical protein
VTDGERLAAYLSGELGDVERREVEAALERDPELRAELARIRRADEALAALPRPEPTAAFSARLRESVRTEMRTGAQTPPLAERASRRGRQRRTLAPVLVAGAAAAVIGVIGVSTGWVLRGASDFDAEVAMEDVAEAEVPVHLTTNDFDDTELRRLAVNVDTQYVIHPDTTVEEAAPLGDSLVGQLLRSDGVAPAAETDALTDAPAADVDRPADDPVAACLPRVLESADAPLVPVYVEVATYEDEPAVIYAFVTEEPESETYRRVETWALAQVDCAVLGSAQYDRTER